MHVSLFKLVGGEWVYWGYWVHGGRGFTSRQVSGLFSVGLYVGAPLLKFDEVCFSQRKWPGTRRALVPNVIVLLSRDGIVSIYSTVESIRWYVFFLDVQLGVWNLGTLCLYVPLVLFFFSLPLLICSYLQASCYGVICVIDQCLHIEGQWMWLYNFMIPSNSITRLSRQPWASVLASIWLLSISFDHLFVCVVTFTISSSFCLFSRFRMRGFAEDLCCSVARVLSNSFLPFGKW